MSKEIKEDITDAVEEYSLDEDLLNLYDKEKIIEADKKIAEDRGYKNGREVGLSQGIKQGIEKSKIEIAKNLLDTNLSFEEISKYTGLKVEEIEKIKR